MFAREVEDLFCKARKNSKTLYCDFLYCFCFWDFWNPLLHQWRQRSRYEIGLRKIQRPFFLLFLFFVIFESPYIIED
ncbi:hypothetical protein E1A91_A03G000100v1 [Gossypium mustelinum]|uniref:Uncharacterized protein n=1 Tax=Gossypium mustelinum TaxID=34275 RepID=A0A5D2ZQT6_GOSMU|nr:hypothetical protein E1A91_A03G000100v1 [Gossypium mustelinum]